MKDVISISLIGAGLVIVGLIALWFIMDILVRLTVDKKTEPISHSDEGSSEADAGGISNQKQLAAASAVSVALMMAAQRPMMQKQKQTGSAWQSINRFSQLHNLPQLVSPKRKMK